MLSFIFDPVTHGAKKMRVKIHKSFPVFILINEFTH